MGNPFLLQACLRLEKKDLPTPLEIGKKYNFSKNEHRLYQINVPMDLRDADWNAYGRCVIIEYTIGNRKTEGTYIMIRVFDEIQAKYATETYVSDEEVKNILNNIK
ncbi:MAG: hypothetical protein AUJ23_03035 [Candidatus Magasanikbacteria bacterium CG1_02_32_51]|uniref:Uncharacterized protein n=1 Tax=Candidatus Magasanikbacteria bacterium CG1_02_32_51 TaxID=1805238 RepID=A0A1J4U8F5_9BACT|nr:MAG: hypothetical protein AUJ23_03035 [Candidatus Magasanikbacteria bacterium CG1_02_32_51]